MHKKLLIILIVWLCVTEAWAHDDDRVECIDSRAGAFSCESVDLLSLVSLATMGGAVGNDLWGWVHPETGREYALMGMDDAVAVVDLSDPTHPVVAARWRAGTQPSIWRDLKVVDGHMVIVSEADGHGLVVVDLRGITADSRQLPLNAVATDRSFGSAHNIAVNEARKRAYVTSADACGFGVMVYDLADPAQPISLGCSQLALDIHDIQCIDYDGPDLEHAGRDICVAASEDYLVFADFTDAPAIEVLSRLSYESLSYVHQAWFDEQRRFVYVGDELDELRFGIPRRTIIVDAADLHEPFVQDIHHHDSKTIDHNMYVQGNQLFQANYEAGIEIFRLDAEGLMDRRAFFDTFPERDATDFNGAWSIYPYLPSGVVLVSDINRGLFVLEQQFCEAPVASAPSAAFANAPGEIRLDLASNGPVDIQRHVGGCDHPGRIIANAFEGTTFLDSGRSGGVRYGYSLTPIGADGCRGETSACIEAETTGPCFESPGFAGIENAAGAEHSCRVDLEWSAAESFCAGEIVYAVHRGSSPDFTPGADTLLASTTEHSFRDGYVSSDRPAWYLISAIDSVTGAAEDNRQRLEALPHGRSVPGTYTNGAELDDPQLSSSKHQGWGRSYNFARSGEVSFYSSATNNTCDALSLEALDLSTDGLAAMSFFSAWDIEDDYDIGVVQISGDAGQSWQTLIPEGGYPASLRESGNACGLPVGSAGFGGESTEAWRRFDFDLHAHAGKSIQLRFLYSTDAGVAARGWWIDDIEIDGVQVPGPCSGCIEGALCPSGGLEATEVDGLSWPD